MTKAEMDHVWRTVQRIGIPLLTALIIGVAGFMLGNREEIHAQDVRLVALEATAPTMETIERRFHAILIEVQSIKGDIRVMRTEMQALVTKMCDLEERVTALEKREREGD